MAKQTIHFGLLNDKDPRMFVQVTIGCLALLSIEPRETIFKILGLFAEAARKGGPDNRRGKAPINRRGRRKGNPNI